MNKLQVTTEFKAMGDSGTFEGYAAMFGNVDLGGDIVERGAFKEFAKRRNGKIIVLNQHRPSDPIGLAEVEQDDRGLKFTGQLVLESASARSAHALMKAGVLDEMSFGYDILAGGSETTKSGIRMLKALKLIEISPVTFAMNPLAGIDSVKARDELFTGGNLPSLKQFEEFLREAGASKTQAAAIAGRGLKEMLCRSESGSDPAAVLAALQSFNIHS